MHGVMKDLAIMVNSQGESVGERARCFLESSPNLSVVGYREFGGSCGESTCRGYPWQPAAG